MNRLKKIADSLFYRKNQDDSGNGLYATIDELIAMRKYLAYMHEIARNKTFSNQAGDIKSAFKGRGMELEEIRGYTYGDDVRDIDWRVTARKDTPYTKIFAEEKDREVYVWLDLSPKMFFGTRKELKSVTAAKIAALIGWLALENKDRFGCVIFDGESSFLFKPQNHRARLTAVLKKIAALSEQGLKRRDYDAGAALKSLKLLEQNVRNRAAVFLLGDFETDDEALTRQLAGLARKTNLFIFNIFDVLEEIAPAAGEYMAEYNGKRLIFDSRDKVFRHDYQEYFASKRRRLIAFCRKFGCRLFEFRTDREFVNNLKFFQGES